MSDSALFARLLIQVLIHASLLMFACGLVLSTYPNPWWAPFAAGWMAADIGIKLGRLVPER